MFGGRLAVAEYFRVNKIDWPIVAVAAVVYFAVAYAAGAAVAPVALVHFDIDQHDTCDTD